MSQYHYQPFFYFVVVFILSYALWLTGGYISFQPANNGSQMLLMLVGLLIPFIIALIMIYTSKNEVIKSDFIHRLINLKLIQLKYLPILLLIMPIAVLLSIAISLPLGGSIEQFQLADGFSFSTGFVPVLLVLLLAATFEELGWRGYAFDSLQSRFSYFKATLIFSVLWSLWHLPLLFVKDSYQYEIAQQNPIFAINFFISIIPMGIIISWICIKNGKSILAAILFHFIINMSQEALAMTQTTKSIETGVLIILAMLIVWCDRNVFFSQQHLH